MDLGMSLEITLDGFSLDTETLARLARAPRVRVVVAEEARLRVRQCRARIEAIVARYRADFAAHELDASVVPVQDYGVTTGFGEFKDIPVPPAQLEELQVNLLLSHSVGIGSREGLLDRAGCLSPEVVRAALLIRINTFLRGHSGISEGVLDTLVAMFEGGVVPLVPARGSLGSSGDLCPLCHLFGPLLGEGTYFLLADPNTLHPGSALAGHLGRVLPAIGAKEGLALSNGATFSAAMLALAVADAKMLAQVADQGAALSLEAACGCARALDPRVHEARGQQGQIESAAHLRALLAGSRLLESAGAVQDAYSLRCAPVVHGAARDAIRYAAEVAQREINAATDNPLFFGEESEPWDWQFAANWPPGYDGRARQSFSAGNFHGEPVAMAADVLAIAVAELANIAERRVQLLLDQHHNRNLPANLVARRGVQSGLMLLQYSAASLVCENKVLAHPASVDSIPTAANIEDHVAVATTAALKLQQVVSNVEAVLAIELMTAAQAIDWRAGMGYGPKPAGITEPPSSPVGAQEGLERVELEARLFAASTAPEKREDIAAKLGQGSARTYLAIRKIIAPVTTDRVLAGDIASLRQALGQLADHDVV